MSVRAHRFTFMLLLSSLPHSSLITGQPSQATRMVTLSAGQTADLWLGVNVTGKVYYVIRSRDGKNELRLWWIRQPLGRVQQLGVRRNQGELRIPSSIKGVVSAKLRGSAVADTVVYIRENASIDNSATIKWP